MNAHDRVTRFLSGLASLAILAGIATLAFASVGCTASGTIPPPPPNQHISGPRLPL